ncbi:MAG: hypothetical protein AB9883_04620 [Acidaminococcaceae bacterium]
MKLHNMKIKTTLALLAIACSFAAMPETFAEKVDTVVPAKAALAAQDKTGSADFYDAVQRGELLATAYGDVDGDGQEEKVLLMGNKFSNDSHYYTKLYLLVRDALTDNIKGAIRPSIAGGYDASLRLADVTGNGVDDILIAAPTGGSGGIVDYRIIDFTDNKPREIFTAEDNQGVQIGGTYLPDYKVRITFGDKGKEVVMSVPTDLGFYGYLKIYDDEGNLLKDYYHPYGQYLSGLLLLDTDGDGVSEVITTQRIVGLNNTDTLGYVRAVWRYTAAAWQLDNYTFQSKLDSLVRSTERENFIGLGGYKVSSEKAVIGRTVISYPRISNAGKGAQQWKTNAQIESFVRAQFDEIKNKGYLEMNYEVKYGGYKLLSILMTGKKEGKGGSEDILKAFNFDLATGELVPLDKLLGNNKKMWEKVAEITSKQGNKVTSDTMNGYYFDGENFVFLQHNAEKQRMEQINVPKKELAKYFADNKIEKQN